MHTLKTASLKATKADIRKVDVSGHSTFQKGLELDDDLTVTSGDIILNGSGVFEFMDKEIHKEETNGEYIPDSFFEKYFAMMRDGQIYGSRIYKSQAKVSNEQGESYDGISGSSQSMGEYLASSVGMRCLPYVEGVQDAVDDFTDKVPMFRKWRCNAYLDENGDIRVKYIQGQEGYKREFADGETAMDDCIMKMCFYWKKEEGDTYYDYFVSDTQHDDTWVPISYCIRHDGTVAPYFALPAYASSLHLDADGKSRPYSLMNQTIQSGVSHDSQLPTYEQTLDEEQLDANTYYGRGRHYGTRADIMAYIMLMQIIKYKTRNLAPDTAPSELNYNVSLPVPNRDPQGNATGTFTNFTIKPFYGKISNKDNLHRCALETYLENYPIFWTDYKKDANEQYTIPEIRSTNKSLYYQFDKNILPADYDSSWFPAAPKLNVTFANSTTETDENGLAIKILQDLSEQCLYRIGAYVALKQQCVSNANDTTILTPDWSGSNSIYNISLKAKIAKIETFIINLPETQIPYDAFEVTKYDGTKMTIPAGFATLPAGPYSFYKVYLEGFNKVPAFDLKLYYNGSCLDENNTKFHPTLKGRSILTDWLQPAGCTESVKGLYDGNCMNTSKNTGLHTYIKKTNFLTNTITYTFNDALSSYSPFRIEGIELLNGYWIVPSDTFLRGVWTKDASGATTEKRFEVWSAKRSAVRHKLLTKSGSWSNLVENDVDRSVDFAKNYEITNLDENSYLYKDAAGDFFNGSWGWIGDVEIEQTAEGKLLMHHVMRSAGINGKAFSANANTNTGDDVRGQPAEPTNGNTKYSYKESLLGSNYVYGVGCGITYLDVSVGLTYGSLNYSRSFLVNSKPLNTSEQ